MDQSGDIEEVFNSAVSVVRNLPKEGPLKPSDELKLKLYAYYKQATHGPNDTSKPRFYQIVESYKWDYWRKLGNMTREQAMLNYVNELRQILETIPEDERQLDDLEGKPFYDYCLKKGLWKGASSASERHESNQESRSSSGSSVSILDGNTSTGEIDDQLAAAVLRLQRGLEETNKRLAKIESQIAYGTSSRSEEKPSDGNIFGNLQAVHWFYLGYPFLVYFIVRTLSNRRGEAQVLRQR